MALWGAIPAVASIAGLRLGRKKKRPGVPDLPGMEGGRLADQMLPGYISRLGKATPHRQTARLNRDTERRFARRQARRRDRAARGGVGGSSGDVDRMARLDRAENASYGDNEAAGIRLAGLEDQRIRGNIGTLTNATDPLREKARMQYAADLAEYEQEVQARSGLMGALGKIAGGSLAGGLLSGQAGISGLEGAIGGGFSPGFISSMIARRRLGKDDERK